MKIIYGWRALLAALLLPGVSFAGSGILKRELARDSGLYVQRVLDERAASLEFVKTTATIADIGTASLYSEINYVTPRSWQKKPFILDAVMNTPVRIGGKWFHIPNRGVYFALQLNPDFEVRVLQNDPAKGDSSSPVRTPSFKPGLTFFITCNKLWNTGYGKPKHYFSFKIYHHSNGQDGYHITSEGYWNLYNGDFSDDVIYEFAYGGMNTGIMKSSVGKELMRAGSGRGTAAYNYYWKGLFSLHPPSGVEQVMREYHIYGYYRTSAQIGFIWAPYYQDYVLNRATKTKNAVGIPVRKEIFRIYATIDYIWDEGLNTGSIYNLRRVKMYDITKRMNAVVTFSARIPGTPFLGLFAQGGYFASDPYNVYFEESMAFFRAGLSVGYFINDMNPDRKKGSLSSTR